MKAANRKIWARQTANNRKQQSMEQQRSSPQRNQKENGQATILVSDTQERDDTTSEDQNSLF